MVAAWEKIRQLHEQENRSIDDTLFEDVSKEFPIGIGKVKEYYGRMQRFIEEHPDVWNRASNASVTRK
jgi:hypothetical protein